MKYAKPSLPLDQGADLLIRRGMAGDRALMMERLSVVNYYRLSGYWFPFRNPDDSFKPGTTFDSIWERYVFDRRLRLMVMDAIERFEVAVRSQLANRHALHHQSPFAYAEDPTALPGLDADRRQHFLELLVDEMKSSKEAFAEHFRAKYGPDHPYMPIWMAAEVMTFGQVLTLYRGSVKDIRQGVASLLGVHDKVVDSWLLTLNAIRNMCAHHGRLWNRQLGVKPLIPVIKNAPQWHVPVPVGNERIFGVLTILKYCLDRFAPQSRWPIRVASLLDEYPSVPKLNMGFPPNWRDCPIWERGFKT
jgi:abortive infection bacteriophage resistance protein